MDRRTIQRLLCACLIALLGLVTAGCAPHSTSSNLLPPQADNPRDYEEIEVCPAKDTTNTLTPDNHTLYSRPLNWRSTGAKETKWCSVDPSIGTLQTGRAHGGEYHAGWAYFMTTPSFAGSTFTPTPLYACDTAGKVTKIIDPSAVPTVAMYDFSVSPDGCFAMLYDEDKDGSGILDLHLWSVEQEKIVATFYAAGSEAPEGSTKKELTGNYAVWDIPMGNGSWHEVAAAGGKPAHYAYTAVAIGNDLPGNVQSFAIIRFDGTAAKDATITRYPMPTDVSFTMKDLQMFDPTTGMVAYDDYPQFIEYGTKLFDFDRAQTPTHLYLYNVITGVNTCIDELPACDFLPQWTRADTLECNARSDPVIRTDPPSPEPPKTYISHSYVSLLTRSDCLPIVYSVTSSTGEEEYHYAIVNLMTMKLFKDTATLAISTTAGTLKGGWFCFPKTAPWHFYSESAQGIVTGLKPVAGTTISSATFNVGNKRYSGNRSFTPSQSLISESSDMGVITDPHVLRAIECAAPSSSGSGIQCVVTKAHDSSKLLYWFQYNGAIQCIELVPGQSIATLCKNPKADSGAPMVVADTLKGKINNLFVPVTAPFPLYPAPQFP
jgi:hypothetical protein